MRAAVEARPCKRRGCRIHLPQDAAPQARYCRTQDCDRERYLERKEKQYAREDAAYFRVRTELEERPKRRTAENEDGRGARTHRIPHLPRDDWSKLEDQDSPGELWLRGKVEAAERKASSWRRRVFAEAEARQWGGDGLWDGLRPSRAQHPRRTVELSEPLPNPSWDTCDSVMRANRGLG
jgi:hypothetical protein